MPIELRPTGHQRSLRPPGAFRAAVRLAMGPQAAGGRPTPVQVLDG